MNFCSHCGHAVVRQIPADDTRERDVCPSCHTIHYENPRNVVGTVPVWEDKILLCRRAIEPRYGFWTLPAGFMEIGETCPAGAVRETLEEAGAQIEIGELFSILDVTAVAQVHLFYLARMTSPTLDPGTETLEARLFSEAEIPWDDIAFPTVKRTLEWFFADHAAGLLGNFLGSGHPTAGFRVHSDVIAKRIPRSPNPPDA